jgi:hypothetical protein
MRKRLTTPIPIPQDAPPLDEGWLELDRAAVVEVTSEEKDYPVESALVLGEVGLEGGRFWHSNHPSVLRQAATTCTHLAGLRGTREAAYPRVRFAMVSG